MRTKTYKYTLKGIADRAGCSVRKVYRYKERGADFGNPEVVSDFIRGEKVKRCTVKE